MASAVTPLKICIIGAGNVASNMAPMLALTHNVTQIVSRSGSSAHSLARQVAAASGHPCQGGKLADIIPNADIYLIAAADDAVAEIAASTANYPGIWAHTSGSVGIEALQSKSRRGVFYPLQTFSKGVQVDFSRVPMLIEGSDPQVTGELLGLASSFSNIVREADSATRAHLHLAAVFACNFADLMWMEAHDILSRSGLDFSLLLPLLQGMVDKLHHTTPAEAMTGPARRGDLGVIRRQMEALPPDQRKIYLQLTQRILSRFGHEQDTL